MMDLKPALKRQVGAVTSVWWDISRCSLPPDVDVRRVGPFIRQGLKKLGYSGPLTITAIGILSEVPPEVLQKLSSTGIHLRHAPHNRVLILFVSDTKAIWTSLSVWDWRAPRPGNLMLISLQRIYGRLLESLSESHYILGPVYPPDPEEPPSIFPRSAGCFLWESLLASIQADSMDSNPGALEEEECSGTGESTLYCMACNLGLLGVGSFTRHLKSKEHALVDLEYYHPKGVFAARELRSRMADATAIQLVLDGFRETARDREREEDEV